MESDIMILGNVRNLKYYKEVDSSNTTYTLKFREGRMHYHLDFNEKGTLQNTGFTVKEVDIPMETYARIGAVLNANFDKIKIKYIQKNQ